MKVSSWRFMVNLLTCLLVLFRVVNLSSLTAYSAHWRSRVPIDLWEPLGTKKSDLYMTLHLGLASQHDYQASLSLCLHLLTSQSPSLAALMSWLPSLAMLRCTQQQRLVVPTQLLTLFLACQYFSVRIDKHHICTVVCTYWIVHGAINKTECI